jgi:cytochrome c oxidase cbb3-type subunit III
VIYQVRGYEKREVIWRILPKIVWVLIFFGAMDAAFCQNSNSTESYRRPQQELRGKGVFEARCATCHGLDGLGGEHAPDIIRRSAVKALSDQSLLDLIHDGIPQRGMPGFSDMSKEDGLAVVAYIRLLQGGSAAGSTPGDAVLGREVFLAKAGCSACHQFAGQGQFIAGDLRGFAQDHGAVEIRDAILKPSGRQPDVATTVALDGRRFSGLIRNEDNASLQLQDGNGRFYLLMKSSLASVQRKTTEPMPTDYGQRLNATEIDDLVAYIRREARAPDVSSSPSGKDEGAHDQD